MTCWRGECQRGCYYPDACSEGALQARVAEFQYNAVEMARKADQAERRAEDAESAYERLRAAADKVGHQAVCPVEPCECWMRDLAPLLHDAVEWERVAECEQGTGDDVWSVAIFREREGCTHEWLDRPESDTRECLICGEETTA